MNLLQSSESFLYLGSFIHLVILFFAYVISKIS